MSWFKCIIAANNGCKPGEALPVLKNKQTFFTHNLLCFWYDQIKWIILYCSIFKIKNEVLQALSFGETCQILPPMKLVFFSVELWYLSAQSCTDRFVFPFLMCDHKRLLVKVKRLSEDLALSEDLSASLWVIVHRIQIIYSCNLRIIAGSFCGATPLCNSVSESYSKRAAC